MTAPAPTSTRPLKRSIGLWMATALVVRNMVGSGIFTLPALLAGEAGPASIVALAFTGVGAMLLAHHVDQNPILHAPTGRPIRVAQFPALHILAIKQGLKSLLNLHLAEFDLRVLRSRVGFAQPERPAVSEGD